MPPPNAPPPVLHAGDPTEQFAHSVLKAALAQVCTKLPDGSSCQVAEGGAFEGLAEAVKRRIIAIGKHASAQAEYLHRTDVQVDDLLTSLATAPSGHAGVRDLKKLKEIADGWDLPPFSDSAIPDFPYVSAPHLAHAPVPMDVGGQERRPLGAHFPPLPPAHTYKRTRIDNTAQLSAADASDHRRLAQERRTLVRESLAQLLRKDEEKVKTGVSLVSGSSLAPVEPGAFARAVAGAAAAAGGDAPGVPST